MEAALKDGAKDGIGLLSGGTFNNNVGDDSTENVERSSLISQVTTAEFKATSVYVQRPEISHNVLTHDQC